MGKQWNGPADTRMMTIVHDGLRRDLGSKVVEAEVPWVPRQIVLHGFGPGYRRRAAARWAATSVGAAR